MFAKIFSWIKDKLIFILIVALVFSLIGNWIEIKIIAKKNKEINILNLQIQGYKLQNQIRTQIEKLDGVVYAKKAKLLQELYSIEITDIDKLIDFLNKLNIGMYQNSSQANRNTTTRSPDIQAGQTH